MICINTNLVGAKETTNTTGFFITNESCCGDDSDPHAVHGAEVPGGGIVLAVKFSVIGNSKDGFAIKFPMIEEEGGRTYGCFQAKTNLMNGFLRLELRVMRMPLTQ